MAFPSQKSNGPAASPGRSATRYAARARLCRIRSRTDDADPEGGFVDVQSDSFSAAGARQPLPASLAHALGWLERRLDEPIRLDHLAAAAGVRPRTLEAHFRLYLGTTPLGWVRRTRLARARQQLLAPGNATNVTEVALANGFGQLGRFAGQYRRQFGETPSQTLNAARAATAARTDESNDEALRLSWRALAAAFTVGPSSCSAALDDVGRAEELAPHDGLPKAIAAWCWSQRAAR